VDTFQPKEESGRKLCCHNALRLPILSKSAMPCFCQHSVSAELSRVRALHVPLRCSLSDGLPGPSCTQLQAMLALFKGVVLHDGKFSQVVPNATCMLALCHWAEGTCIQPSCRASIH
jgi:hypothetical protein